MTKIKATEAEDGGENATRMVECLDASLSDGCYREGFEVEPIAIIYICC
jgi:hypothetical protein